MGVVLAVENVSKTYDRVEAVRNISFRVDAGEILGLLGPNGAGKTTTISMILGVLEPSDGTISILGKAIRHQNDPVARELNFAAVHSQVPPNLSVLQNLTIFGMLYDVPELRERIDTLLREFDLHRFRHTKAGLLSSGELSRLNLAKALINRPKLLLLDEPTASLDPSVARDIRVIVKTYAERSGAAVLWTSHNMSEIEQMCTRVLFLSRGRILLSGNPKSLPGEHGRKNLEELFIAIAREPLKINN
ncbi:MAG: ABC transporter ATP-binding protein [Desulforhopalus sp.]